MLRRLTIADFGLIAQADVTLADGLTIFSGETGSGKTMLLGALQFVLGGRADVSLVRSGGARARVALTVDPPPHIREWLASEGFPIDPAEDALLERELSAAGKSSARLNGRAATAATLREIADRVSEVVGQHAHQRLLSADFQLEALDRFGGAELLAQRGAVNDLFDRRATLAAEGARLREHLQRSNDDRALARFAVDEIAAAGLVAGEDVMLRARRAVLANTEKTSAALRAAYEALRGDDDPLGVAASALGPVARYNLRLAGLAETARALQSEVSDLAAAVAAEIDGAEFDPTEFDALTERLDALERLKKKYGGSMDAVFAARDRFEAMLEGDEARGERIAGLERDLAALDGELDRAGAQLSELRAAAAARVESAVRCELRELAMPNAEFSAALERTGAIGRDGFERCTFLLAANAGEERRPLARVASGGELSRVLLALVVTLAATEHARAFLFDEVDAGIGGATARAVGVRLHRLARRSQVICVTHLAQIASWADDHWTLRKRERGGATTIAVDHLPGGDERTAEVARMLSGESRGISAEHAQTLLREASAAKRGAAF